MVVALMLLAWLSSCARPPVGLALPEPAPTVPHPCEEGPDLQAARAANEAAVARWWQERGDGRAIASVQAHFSPMSVSDGGTSWVTVDLSLEGEGTVGSFRVYPSCRVEVVELACERCEIPPIAGWSSPPAESGRCMHGGSEEVRESASAAATWWEAHGDGTAAVGYRVGYQWHRLTGIEWAAVDVVAEGRKGQLVDLAWVRVDAACRVERTDRPCGVCPRSREYLVRPYPPEER
jgi:hypothetical protein